MVLPDADFRDDAMLTTAANNALMQNVTVPDTVEASALDGNLTEASALDGNLTLTGTVEYGVERAAAERAVAGLTGVRNVRDEIEISYDNDSVDVDLHVQQALARSALVADDSDVKVATDGSTITLTGHVRTWAEHDAVVGVVEVTLVAISVGFGAPRATAVLAVLGYRIINYWLPLLPGAIAYLRLRLRSATAGSREPSTPPTG